METLGPFTIALEKGYRFKVDFGLAGVPGLMTDATPPLGQGHGPDSEMLLMAAVANCLSASLAFSLRKFRNEDVPMRASVEATLSRNERGRLRMHSIAVDIHLGVNAARLRLVDRALAQYEDFCVVTQSVRAAIPVAAQVFDSEGVRLSPPL
jgi:organic hydroperoxide reductase OsmC/OhrA